MRPWHTVLMLLFLAAWFAGLPSEARAAPACSTPNQCLLEAQRLLDVGGGVPGPENRRAALGPAEKACAGEEWQGCHFAGFILAEGIGVPKDEARALEFFRKGCAGGDPFACQGVGVLLVEGQVGPEHILEGLKALHRGCVLAREEERTVTRRRGAVIAICPLVAISSAALHPELPGHLAWARELRRQVVEGERIVGTDDRDVLLFHTSALICEEGGTSLEAHAPACVDAARLLREDALSPGTRRWPEIDLAVADEIEVNLCDAGYAPACAQMAEHLQDRRGPAALAAAERACAGEQWPACLQAGRMLVEGHGVPQDRTRALGLFRRGCAGGEPMACHGVGALLAGGEGGAEHILEGLKAYLRGCTLGHEKEGRQGVEYGFYTDTLCPLVGTSSAALTPQLPGHLAHARELRQLIRGNALRRLGDRGWHMAMFHTNAVFCEGGQALFTLEVFGEACLEAARFLRQDGERGSFGHERWMPSFDPAWSDGVEHALCEAGYAEACAARAEQHQRAHASNPNQGGAAAAHFDALCQQGLRRSCEALADWYHQCDPAQPVPAGSPACDPPGALSAWQGRCAAGDNEHACHVSEALTRLVAARAALAATERACVGGDQGACLTFAAVAPWGPARNAVLQAACDAETSNGCYGLAIALSVGEGVPADRARAGDLVRYQCTKWGSDGCFRLCYRHPEACTAD